jgi:signal peptidase I
MTVDTAATTPPAPAPDSTAAQQPPTPPPVRHEGGYRDTIESILIAFILAFIFRAFVVEAFVIPTGSMAPTLLGAHARFTCDDCGYQFDHNYSSPGGDDQSIPAQVPGDLFPPPTRDFRDRDEHHLDCPNCGHVLHDPTRPRKPVPIHYGDRILVLKYAYLLSSPARWDVVVFKTPDRTDDERRQVVPPYTVNYIKRLVGRPGESAFILDGDIYVGAADAEPERHVVQTKPRSAQEALWRIVYDNDYRPAREDWREPWVGDGGDGWGPAPGHRDAGLTPQRVLKFDNPAGAGWLRFDAEASGGNQALTDWLAYAATKYAGAGDSYDHRSLIGRNNVSDLKLSLFYERHGGDGPLRLQLTKLGRAFTAELTPGRARLLSGDERDGEPVELASAALPTSSGRPLHVEFMNVDYQVTLRVDGRDLIRTTPEQYRPDVDTLLRGWRSKTQPKPEIRLGAEAQACTLSHITLWRDVYYTNQDSENYSSDIKWGIPSRPVRLGPDEYWVLGDNSLMSGDGRYWGMPVDLPEEGLRAQPGVVPGRFLLGKAFFVYWPAGYRLSPSSPGVVPNFGHMRFIH